MTYHDAAGGQTLLTLPCSTAAMSGVCPPGPMASTLAPASSASRIMMGESAPTAAWMSAAAAAAAATTRPSTHARDMLHVAKRERNLQQDANSGTQKSSWVSGFGFRNRAQEAAH